MADLGTQAAFLARLREELKDTTIPYLWTDKVLSECLIDASNEYAELFPKIVLRSVTTSAATVVYGPISYTTDNWVYEVIDCQNPPGTHLERDQTVIGEGVPTTRLYQQAYGWDGANLYLRNDPTGDAIGAGKLIAVCLAYYYQWTADAISLVTTDIPFIDWRLVLLIAQRQAWRQAVVQGIKAPADLDLGNAITELEVVINQTIAHKQSRAHGKKLHR